MKRAANGVILALMVCLTLAIVGLSVAPANAQVIYSLWNKLVLKGGF